jgi:hypothetical protein
MLALPGAHQLRVVCSPYRASGRGIKVERGLMGQMVDRRFGLRGDG